MKSRRKNNNMHTKNTNKKQEDYEEYRIKKREEVIEE